jgi:hypothetical protein
MMRLRKTKRADIYLVRQHIQVGDERIITAYLDRQAAKVFAVFRNMETNSKNFDVGSCDRRHCA